jgi:hypothetical protein
MTAQDVTVCYVTICKIIKRQSSFLSRALNNGSQFRRRYPPDGVILCRTGDHALATFDAEFLVHPFFSISGGKDGLHRAAPYASVAAACTFPQINVIGGQLSAHASRTSFLLDMRHVLIPEILQGSEDRVGCGPT